VFVPCRDVICNTHDDFTAVMVIMQVNLWSPASPSWELEDFVGAEFYCPHALATRGDARVLLSCITYSVCGPCHDVTYDRHPFNSFFFQDSLGKLAREWLNYSGWSNLDVNDARDDGVTVISGGPYADHLHLTADRLARQHFISQFLTG